jgi:ribose-phosphate pyrophosphokinase
MKLFTGQANVALAAATAQQLDVPLVRRDIARFPDGELHVELREAVRGDDVYVIQPTGPPVEEHLFELLLLADACRRAGAARVSAVMPYFGYARHDRRATGREAVAARLVADLIGAAGIARVIAVDLHVTSLEGFFPMPLEHLSAVPALAAHLRGTIKANSVLVSPDLGAAKLVERYAAALELPVAIVHKRRISADQVVARAIAGEVRDRAPLIADDMISTGGTIVAAVEALLAAGSRPEIDVVTTHAVLAGNALARLANVGVQRLITTDSLCVAPNVSLGVEVVSLAPILADAIDRLHHERSLGNLIVHA